MRAEQEGIHRIEADRRGVGFRTSATAVAGGNWTGCGRNRPDGKTGSRIDQGIARIVDVSSQPHRAAAAINSRSPGEGKLADEPVEAEFVEVVLGNLQKLRLDFDLCRTGCYGGFHQTIDQIEIELGIFNNQPTGAGNIIGAGSRGEGNALGFQKILGFRAGGDGLAVRTGFGSAAGHRLHEAGRNLVFLGDKHIGVFGLGHHHDRVGLDLDFQICRASDIVEGRAKGDILE